MAIFPFLAVLSAFARPEAQTAMPGYWRWARTPPMGWNSWDGFGTTVTEGQTRAQIDVMSDRLKQYGWQYIVVDIQWYEPNSRGFDYRAGAKLAMDRYGRLLPAPSKFPSAADGRGFRALAGYAHRHGLKFGCHLMRGIPRQAVANRTPIQGTNFTASDVADTRDICPWNSDMYGVDMSKPGAQSYYDSVFRQFAVWGLDFVKIDDLSAPYHAAEIEAIRHAIDHCGRPIVLSTSPGPTPVSEGPHISLNANMWRISGDFWDDWHALFDQFARVRDWSFFRGTGVWPDADMLPIGVLRMGSGKTHFTPDEQVTLMTLWSIARSPLMLGADLTKLDGFTLGLITNPEVLRVNQESALNRELFRRGGQIGWAAIVPGTADRYVALFNTNDTPSQVTVPVRDADFVGTGRVRDLWARRDLGPSGDSISANLPAHGAALFRLTAGGRS